VSHSAGQQLLLHARAEGDAIGDGRSLQGPQRAHFLAVGFRLGHAGLAHVQHQAVQVDVEICAWAKALDECDHTAMAFVDLKPDGGL